MWFRDEEHSSHSKNVLQFLRSASLSRGTWSEQQYKASCCSRAMPSQAYCSSTKQDRHCQSLQENPSRWCPPSPRKPGWYRWHSSIVDSSGLIAWWRWPFLSTYTTYGKLKLLISYHSWWTSESCHRCSHKDIKCDRKKHCCAWEENGKTRCQEEPIM